MIKRPVLYAKPWYRYRLRRCIVATRLWFTFVVGRQELAKGIILPTAPGVCHIEFVEVGSLWTGSIVVACRPRLGGSELIGKIGDVFVEDQCIESQMGQPLC